MRARHAVPLTAQEADSRLPPATSLESTRLEMFTLNNLNLFRMSTDRGRACFAQFWCKVSPFRINTCKSVSKQTTLTPFRMNTYEKHGGWGGASFFFPVNSVFSDVMTHAPPGARVVTLSHRRLASALGGGGDSRVTRGWFVMERPN